MENITKGISTILAKELNDEKVNGYSKENWNKICHLFGAENELQKGNLRAKFSKCKTTLTEFLAGVEKESKETKKEE